MGYLSDWGDSVPDCMNYRFENSLINTFAEGDSCFVDVTFDVKDTEPFGKGHFKLVDHDVFDYDFHLTAESTARLRASDSYVDALPLDLDGVPRKAGAVDAGCYQYVKEEE